jgi:hypothetical protein
MFSSVQHSYSIRAMKTLGRIFIYAVLAAVGFGQTQDKIEWGEKFNSDGATLVLKEIGRTRIKNQTVVTYNAYASGLPKDVGYTLWTRLVGSKPQPVADAYINKDGLVVNVRADPARNIAEDPIDLKVFAGRGEPKLFGLIADDGQVRAFGEVVPFPIENKCGQCSISATMKMPNYFMVSIVVTGLQPREQFQVDEQSGNEASQTKATAESDGSYRSILMPVVKGQSSGTFRFNVNGKSCQVGVEAPWGQGSYVIQ